MGRVVSNSEKPRCCVKAFGRSEEKSEARKTEQSERRQNSDGDDEFVVSYVDTLLDLELPEEKRKLEDKEMVNLCVQTNY